MPLTSTLLALLLQVGPNPTAGGLPDDLLRDRPPPRRSNTVDQNLNPTSAWLETCLDRLAEDAARAHTMAQIRASETSGPDRVLANHCRGTAATELGLWDDAREAFLAAREETPDSEQRTRARFGTMAGNAALASGDAEGALALLVQARADARAAAAGTLEALAAIDTARALVTLGRAEEALGALETATRLEPERAEGWLLTATLLRRLDRLGAAQAAIERAAPLAPTDPDIGVEAGLIAVLSGREDAARQSWQTVIALQPDSAAAAVARDYLAQLGPPTEPATEPAPPAEETPL